MHREVVLLESRRLGTLSFFLHGIWNESDVSTSSKAVESNKLQLTNQMRVAFGAAHQLIGVKIIKHIDLP